MRILLVLLSLFLLVTISFAKPLSKLCPSGACQYVVVTPTSLAANYQSLVDWKTSRGVKARIVTTEFITEHYSVGDQAKNIRQFLRDAYKTWGIKYALLGGDVELVGCRIVKTKVHEYETMPADLYFASLNGGWNGDGDDISGEVTDGVDLDPEIFVGRASVRTPEEVATFVDKVLKYEKAPPAGAGKRCLWLGANLDEQTFGKDVCQAIIKDAKVPECIENKLLSTVDGNLDLESAKAAIHDFVPNIMFVAAHGGDNLIAFDGSYIQTKDAEAFTNGFPFIYVATCCLTNKFDEDCITETMMRNPNGGAVAAWACSRYGWYTSGTAGYGSSDIVTKDMFNLLYRSYLSDPPALGELIHRARRKFIDRAQDDNVFRWLTYGMNLLGCPEMPVWTGEQKEIQVQVFDNEQFGNESLDVSVTNQNGPIDGAHVTLWRASSDSPIIVTAWGLNLVPPPPPPPPPKTVQTKVLVDLDGELLVSGKTDESGLIRLEIKKAPASAALLVEELLALSNSLEQLAKYLKTVDSSDRKRLERLMRDYTYTEHRIAETQKNILAFFKEQANNKNWDVAEEALDTIYTRMSGKNGNLNTLAFVLSSLSKALTFNWSALSEDTSPQGRVFRKLLRLKKQVAQLAQGSVSQNEMGRITVTSKPEGAQVLIDGIPIGSTPGTFSVEEGEHTVSAVQSGATIGASTISVETGETKACHFDLLSERSFSGKVTLYGAESNGGVTITLYRSKPNQEDVVIGKSVTSDDGKFEFKELPNGFLYAHIECEGYSDDWKTMRFNDPEMATIVDKEFVLYKLARISGKVTIPGNERLTVRLYEEADHGMTMRSEVEVSNGDDYIFGELPPGTYLVGMTGAGLTAAVRWAKLEKGNSAVDKHLIVAAVETVQLAHYVGGDKRWEMHDMVKGDDGLYRLVYPAPPSERHYWFMFVLNKGLKSESWVMDKHNQPQENQGSTCSTILIEEEGTEVFFDPSDTPMVVKVEEKEQSD